MGKVLELIKRYNEGELTFEALKANLIAFPWRDLGWPQIFEREKNMTIGAMLLDEHGDMGFPEDGTVEELEAAQIHYQLIEEDQMSIEEAGPFLTDEEFDELYDAVLEAHREGAKKVQENRPGQDR